MYTHARSMDPSRTRAHPPPIPHATRPPPSPGMMPLPRPAFPLMSQPSHPPLRQLHMPAPVIPNPSPPSNAQQSSMIHHTHTQTQTHTHRHRSHHHSQSTPAIPRAIHRTNSSQQLRFAPIEQPVSHPLKRANSSHNLQRSLSSQHLRAPTPHSGYSGNHPPMPHSGHSGNHNRPRVNSAGNAHRPVVLPQQQVQPHMHQHVIQHNGHVHFQYSKCNGRKKALCVST